MSEPIEIILNQNRQLLRLSCGQCGDTKDIILDVLEDGRLSVLVLDPIDYAKEEDGSHCYLKPVHLVV